MCIWRAEAAGGTGLQLPEDLVTSQRGLHLTELGHVFTSHPCLTIVTGGRDTTEFRDPKAIRPENSPHVHVRCVSPIPRG